MWNTSNTVAPAKPAHSDTENPFDTVKKSITIFGAVGVIVLVTVAALTFFVHQPASAFMWIRGAVLLLAAPLLSGWASRAAQGTRKAFDRLQTVTTIMPIAVIGVDLIPGVCPAWYAVMQGVSVLPLIAVAIITRGARTRAAFREAEKA